LNYMAPVVRGFVADSQTLAPVMEAFRTGGGVPFSEYGADERESMADGKRMMFLTVLGNEWLPAIPDVHGRLLADPPARVADIGCGAGWSSIGIAQTYPNVHVDGYDLDEPSIELARANAIEAGLEGRVAFHVQDASDSALAGRYDMVIAIDCIHDMSNPVGGLRTMRRLAGEDGAVLVVAPRVGDVFTAEGYETEPMFYAISLLHCLPVSMADQPSAATGTVMRVDTFRHYASEAGFRSVEIVPIEDPGQRLYRLHS
jgi:2-polyprenyl-3-methyl-5-hydroxy-6-metoxy-1,4-benzoquinol methylase